MATSEPLQNLDLYRLEELLTPEQRASRDRVREWVQNSALPRMPDAYEDDAFPTDLIAPMAAMGAFGTSIKGYGCPGLDALTYGLIMQELEAGDSALRTCASVQGALAMSAIALFGSEQQKEHWLPLLASGQKLGCFGLTEPSHGSDPGSMNTTASLQNGQWIINGSKTWIGHATIADVAVIWAKVRDDSNVGDIPDSAIRGFLVDTTSTGYSASQIKGKLSLRASTTGCIELKNCVAEEASILPNATGLNGPLACLDQARYGIAFGVVGAAHSCFTKARDYALERIQFGKPLARFQLVQSKLADMATKITQAQLTCLRLSQLKDAGHATTVQISLAKRANVEIAITVARQARDLLGGSGILNEHHVMRHLCNLESVRTYEGTHDIHTLILGRALTGISAFR
ncbi:MAG: acyl-CoA dehydrogenase family protein [Phycisphaerales bacterium]|nr:acyl-CoA dehydrogenase family protein [Phycisphaerales bacterium]